LSARIGDGRDPVARPLEGNTDYVAADDPDLLVILRDQPGPGELVYCTPDFIRQRMIQRRQILRERAKAQALYDAPLQPGNKADKPASNG